MTRRYLHPIRVYLKNNRPHRFIWRDTPYRVRAILGTWHLRDRWWSPTSSASSASLEPSTSQTLPTSGTTGTAREHQESRESDRLYYRLDCSPDLQCEIYHDRASGLWILDRIYD